MKKISTKKKQRRNLRALFILSFIINSVAAFGGGLVFVLYYYKLPDSVELVWRNHQILMFYGIINLGLVTAILIQYKKKFLPGSTEIDT